MRNRGGWWVAGQVTLMLAVLLAGWWTRQQWSGTVTLWIAGLLALVGAYTGIAGALVLGRNRTIFPAPRAEATLVSNGIYSRIRHPLYCSVVLLTFAWSLWMRSGPALLVATILTVFLAWKASSEEKRLQLRFPEYAEYRQRTKRFLPWIY